MIVVTGPGRSGTSVLARLYDELGFTVEGVWRDEVDAGLEDAEIVAANRTIAARLSLTTNVGRTTPLLHKLAASTRTPGPIRTMAGRALLARTARRVGRLDWAARDAVVEQLGGELRSLAAARVVGKDPQFVYTLGVWAAADAEISNVVLAMRSIDACVDSRADAGLRRNLDRDALANSLVFGVGLCMFAAAEFDIPLSVVRFPDFLDDPVALHAALPFPTPVGYEDFLPVFRRVVDHGQVRFGR